MAEAVANYLHKGRLLAFSAGSAPELDKHQDTKGVHPGAIKTLERNHIPTEGLHSKKWDPFIQSQSREGAPQGQTDIDFVITLCGSAKNDMDETCPVFPGAPLSAHWGVEDPAKATGTQEEIDRIFHEVFLIIKRRIELFASLPLETLDKKDLQAQINDIGNR